MHAHTRRDDADTTQRCSTHYETPSRPQPTPIPPRPPPPIPPRPPSPPFITPTTTPGTSRRIPSPPTRLHILHQQNTPLPSTPVCIGRRPADPPCPTGDVSRATPEALVIRSRRFANREPLGSYAMRERPTQHKRPRRPPPRPAPPPPSPPLPHINTPGVSCGDPPHPYLPTPRPPPLPRLASAAASTRNARG